MFTGSNEKGTSHWLLANEISALVRQTAWYSKDRFKSMMQLIYDIFTCIAICKQQDIDVMCLHFCIGQCIGTSGEGGLG